MDKVSKAVLTMIAAAIFVMSLLIAYGANDLKLAHEAKVANPPSKAVEVIKVPLPGDPLSNEELEIELDDEDFDDFGKPIIDLESNESDANSDLQGAANASAVAAAEAGDAAGATVEAAEAGLAAESTSE
jgi:hypothetical protein